MLTRHADPVVAGDGRRMPAEVMLQLLPAQHREILVATYFHGRTPAEAAKALGITPAVAKARLHQAMRDLALML